MSRKKLLVFKIRWTEQGTRTYYEPIIKAHSESEALKKLGDNLILKSGIGKHYIWVVWTMCVSDNECMLTRRMYMKRLSEIL